MDRLTIAYLLIALIVIALAGAIALNLYTSRDRTVRRRLRKEEARHRPF